MARASRPSLCGNFEGKSKLQLAARRPDQLQRAASPLPALTIAGFDTAHNVDVQSNGRAAARRRELLCITVAR